MGHTVPLHISLQIAQLEETMRACLSLPALVAQVGSSASDSKAVMTVQPAEGPSLGVEPAGTCTWMEESEEEVGLHADARGLRARKGVRDAGALLHDFPELACRAWSRPEPEPVVMMCVALGTCFTLLHQLRCHQTSEKMVE